MLADLGYTEHVSILIVCGHLVSELHAVSELELVAQRPDVCLYRICRDMEGGGDLPVGVSVRHHAYDFCLPRSQPGIDVWLQLLLALGLGLGLLGRFPGSRITLRASFKDLDSKVFQRGVFVQCLPLEPLV